MRFITTPLEGAFVVELDLAQDDRGFFARTFCAREFQEHGLETCIAQCNLSRTRNRGALRGLHYQIAPATEVKLVRCTRGALLDVIVDVRPESPTYLHHLSVELSEDSGRALYV